jgi:hypothetical protein
MTSDTIAFIGLTLTVGAALWNFSTRLARIELKANTAWEFLVRRAFGEAVNDEIVKTKSEFHLADDARGLYGPIALDLEKFWKDEGHGLAPVPLFIAVEQRWGEWLLHNICIPRKLSQGACVIGAIEFMKEATT